MKFLPLLFVFLIVSPVRSDDARPAGKPEPVQQSPALPLLPLDAGRESQPFGESGLSPGSAPSLLPDVIQPAPKPALPLAKRNSATLRPPATSAELDLRIRYRRARNIAESDRGVRAAWDESRAARTDPAKRTAMKRYYDALRGKMLAIDGGLASLIEQHKRQEGVVLEQFTVTPMGLIR